MSRIIHTNLPSDNPIFDRMQACLTKGMGLPYRLEFSDTMEKYVNANNVFFECVDDRERPLRSLVNACNALHRLIINFELASNGEY